MTMMVGGVWCCDLWGAEPRKVWWGCESHRVHTNSHVDDDFLVGDDFFGGVEEGETIDVVE